MRDRMADRGRAMEMSGDPCSGQREEQCKGPGVEEGKG